MMRVNIEHTEFGHITVETHIRACRAAKRAGVWPKQILRTEDDRELEIQHIEANWDGRPRAYVRNTKTGRFGWWFVDTIVNLYEKHSPGALLEAKRRKDMIEKLKNWFTYHKPEGDDPAKYELIRNAGLQLATAIVENTPPSADQTTAIRKVREAVMTANAAIACKGQ